MLILKITEEITDRNYYEYLAREGKFFVHTISFPKQFKFSDGKTEKIVAGDKKSDEILNLLIKQDEDIRNNNLKLIDLKLITEDKLNDKTIRISDQTIKLKKIEQAKELINGMDKGLLSLLKRTYEENKQVGGTLSIYKDFFDCFLNYYM
jgi:hypothetical protein